MSTLGELLTEPAATAEQPRATPIREQTRRTTVLPSLSVAELQVHELIQQLFFRHESRHDSIPVRHVAFAAIEACTETAILCLEIARALAREDRYDIGLIDANPGAPPMQLKLQVPSLLNARTSWPIEQRLWMAPRQTWLADDSGQHLTGQSLSQLREITADFDFSILWCSPASWLTATIAQACDGLVLILTANKTRRLVAAQIKEQLNQAHVPLLGTVLAERRFPVPQGLYRNL